MPHPDDAPPSPPLPERFGEYRVLALLGEGGMGAVYEAEQQRPRRRVALKVIRPGLASGEMLRRFEHEAALLARLQHPGIAQVHEAGTFDTADGGQQPYFAMELVRGPSLTRYADEHQLDTRQRLALMVKVCEAVQHAHQRAVIHRDLKPANILVDDLGQPKILDFGVARLTDSDVQTTTMHTDVGQIIGTLPYMSPEQASGRPEELDTRSDVYALGVLCYELLARRLPHDLKKQVVHEALRIIREDEPSRLSSIDRTLRGDVETIVGKALEKDKERRYTSAGELGTDIQRFLRDEAILARPAGTWYQVARFARRNRVLVGGVATTFVALAAGLVVSARMYVDAAEARDLAESRRKLAETNEGRALSINDFLLEILAAPGLQKLGREAKVSQALDAASRKVESSFAGQPEVELGVQDVLARTYVSLGMYDEAEPHALRWIELHERLPGVKSLQVEAGTRSLAQVQGARGDHAAAERIYREALERTTAEQGPRGTTTLELTAELANELRQLGRSEESEALYRDLVRVHRDRDGTASRGAQIALNSLAVLLQDTGRVAEAEPLYRESAEIGERLWGPDNDYTLTAAFNLAGALRDLGRNEEAEAGMLELAPRFRRVFGDAHLKTATVVNQLAILHARRGDWREALPLAEEAVRIVVRVQGEHTLQVADYEAELARLQTRVGDAAGALRTLRHIVQVRSDVLGPEHERTITTRTQLANALVAAGQSGEAETEFRALIDALPRVLGLKERETAVLYNSYGQWLSRARRLEECREWTQRALDTLLRAYPADDRDVAITEHNLMHTYRALGRRDDALALAPEVAARFERVYGARHPDTAAARYAAAGVLRDSGRFDEAERLYLLALESWRETLGDGAPEVAMALGSLGVLRLARGDAAGALGPLQEALARFEVAPGSRRGLLDDSRRSLGVCLTKLARFAEAEPLLVAAQRSIEADAGAPSEARRRAVQSLVDLYTAWSAVEPTAERAAQLGAWRERLAAPPGTK
ncbi:MAG: serine/threonine protein kinase [Planctomycetes bacterium]|nr:serine/threonine protein kinase [Planctomycetota bacterium]